MSYFTKLKKLLNFFKQLEIRIRVNWHKFWYFYPKNITKLSENMRWIWNPRSEMRYGKNLSRIRIQGSKKHRFPVPQQCVRYRYNFSCFGIDVTGFFLFIRCGQGLGSSDANERSPIFIQVCKQWFIENLSQCLHGYVIFDVIKLFPE